MFSNLQNIAGCSLLTFFGVAGWQISDRLTSQHITLLIAVIGALAFAVVGGVAVGIGLSLAGRPKARSEARPAGQIPYAAPVMSSQFPNSPQPTGSFTLKDSGGWFQ